MHGLPFFRSIAKSMLVRSGCWSRVASTAPTSASNSTFSSPAHAPRPPCASGCGWPSGGEGWG
eukprot:1637447-Alexandrium_andersonii.AAC.1